MPKVDPRFHVERTNNIKNMADAKRLDGISRDWMREAGKYNYTYNFDWLGVPIIQFPNDIVALQELVVSYEPDIIIETGIARGGSVILSASLLALLDLRESLVAKTVFKQKRKVIGIDIDIREHTHLAIQNEPLASYIELIEGSSISKKVISNVKKISKNFSRPLVLLDSNHAHNHVLAELESFHEMIPVGGFILIYDTSIEWDDNAKWQDRDWGPGNSPRTAILRFLKSHPNFKVIKDFSDKLKISVCPEGLIQRVS